MTFLGQTRCAAVMRQAMGMLGVLLLSALGSAQPPTEMEPPTPVEAGAKAEAAAKMPEKVVVKPVARDDEIADRLSKILIATGWFRNPTVTVNEGVVFLSGQTDDEPFKKWAGDLARNTGDVVAVVNQIAVDDPPLWDSSAVLAQLKELSRAAISGLPMLVFAILVLTVAWFLSRLVARIFRRLLNRSIKSDLLLRVTATAIGLLVFLVAFYLVLRVAGLTQIALTVAGGTGVLGLALGIAFREITENFLASIYLTRQRGQYGLGTFVRLI